VGNDFFLPIFWPEEIRPAPDGVKFKKIKLAIAVPA
jgi:hypothetical protein